MFLKSLLARFIKQEASVTQPAPPNFAPPGSSTLGTQPALRSGSSVAASSEHLIPHPSNSQIPPPTAYQVSNPASTSGFFANSRQNVINNSTMISVSNTFETGGGAIMQLLESKTIQGAEHDSSARYPPPKCHPETRKSLRGVILDWVVNPQHSWRMFYVLGPAGVGKSAVAQTVADEVDCLGASCFISRPNRRNDPDGVIPTLAYQLAVKHAAYKQIISQKIAHDPAILRKTRRVQFKELLIDPFLIIMTQDVSTIRKPLLIIIDGLDECEDQGAQCEFIELIGDHVRSFPEFPLLWLICSRPEPHLKYTLSQADFQVTCRREEISVDDEEGRQDVLLYLRGEFRKIRLKHQDSLDCNWPREAHLLRIATAASGLFAFASTVARFIGDTKAGDPSSQLRVCLKVLEGYRTSIGRNPYLTLDLLYRHILSSITPRTLRATMKILGLSILYPDDGTSQSTQALANFFRMGQAAFYHALEQLHSVLRIPPSSDAFKNRIEFYHASFADFLRDSGRSGEFYLDEAAVHYDVALTGLHWYTHSVHEIQEDDIWVTPSEDAQIYLESIKSPSRGLLWKACPHVEGENAVKVYQELQNFDFNVLGSSIPDKWRFDKFLMWLKSQEALLPTQELSDSLNYYKDCDEIEFTEIRFPSEWPTDLITRNSDEQTKIHLNVGIGQRRRHIHVMYVSSVYGTPPDTDLLAPNLLVENIKNHAFYIPPWSYPRGPAVTRLPAYILDLGGPDGGFEAEERGRLLNDGRGMRRSLCS